MDFKLELSWHINEQMITALIFKKIKDFLASKWDEELFKYIKSIKINSWKLIIKTQKPIINSELKKYTSDFIKITESVFYNFSINYKEIKITYL